MIGNRRKTLKILAWSTPVIQTVILPVHAQTSATTTSSPINQSYSGIDMFDPGGELELCVEVNGSSVSASWTNAVRRIGNSFYYTEHAGSGVIGEPFILISGCPELGVEDYTLYVDNPTETGIFYRLTFSTGHSLEGILPSGNCQFPIGTLDCG